MGMCVSLIALCFGTYCYCERMTADNSNRIGFKRETIKMKHTQAPI